MEPRNQTAGRRLAKKFAWSKKGVFNWLIFAFLLFNLVIRFGTIFRYPPYNALIAGLFGGVVAGCIFAVCRPTYMRYLLFVFGFSFFLFGFGSIDIQSRIFELIVTLVAATLFVINRGITHTRVLNRPLMTLLLCYVVLSFFSLLLLPLRTMFRDLLLFEFWDFLFYFFISPPHSFYYSAAAWLRLMLFALLAVELARGVNSDNLFKSLFFGIFWGAVLSALIGLMDYYGVISVIWYRMGVTKSPGVLHSTFLNSGWFAEFVLVSVPFVLIGMQSARTYFVKILLIATLILCEIALILCAARAGWVSYPLILLFCWVFFYLSKEGRLEEFHFKWRDVVKIAVSVPLTIIISLVLVFYLLMPLLDGAREKGNFKGTAKDSKSTTEFIRQEASTVFTPSASSRPMRWRQGFHMGMEGPLFGVGYESYARHALILSDLPSSGYAKVEGSNAQTSHGTIFQLFVNGGVVGVLLWFMMMGYGLTLLVTDLIKNKKILNIPVVISIIAFHSYGIFQSMQYIPMIWSIIFLCLGYAMTMDEGVLPPWLRRVVSRVVVAAVIVVGLSFFFYLYNIESRNLAEKYGLRVYAMDQDLGRFAGFYQDSKRWKYGDFRWCGRRGSILIAERGARNAECQGLKPEEGGQRTEDGVGKAERGAGSAEDLVVGVEFYCRTPGMEEEPVVVTVSHEGEVVDEILFGGRKSEVGSRQEKGKKRKGKKDQGITVRRSYEVPIHPGEEGWLDIEVSRTWIPHDHLGNFDRRELGIGVKILNGEG